jgi:hypothetical protein
MNFWQIVVLALLALIAWYAFNVVRRLDRLSRQICNLFMLTATAHKLPLTGGGAADESCNGFVVGHVRHLKHWENKTYHRFLADGMTPDDALGASQALWDSQARWIAANAPQRIKNGCNNVTDSNLCPTCAENYAAAETTWAKLLEEEKASGKILDAFRYSISTPPCPTSLEEFIAETDKFIAEYGKKSEQKSEQ